MWPVATDTAGKQAAEGTVVVYVDARGDGDLAAVGEALERPGPAPPAALAHNLVVVRGGRGEAGLGVMAAAAGATIAEHFRAQGRDALVVVDDLDVHQAPFLLFVVHLCACVRVLYHTSCVHVLQHVCVRARVVHQLPRPHACA